MTTAETIELVRFVLAAYPAQRARMSGEDAKAMVAAYAAGLADVELEHAQAAATRLIRTSKWLPSVSEIREAIGVVHAGERRSGIDAWGDVIAMRTYRDRDALETFDPLSVEICRRFGWLEWRVLVRGGRDFDQWHVSSCENEPADRARFAEAYDKLTASARREAQAAPGALPAGGAVEGAKTLPAAAHELVTGVARALAGSR